MGVKHETTSTYNMPTDQDIADFKQWLVERESARATMEKYLRDVRRFKEFLYARGWEAVGAQEASEGAIPAPADVAPATAVAAPAPAATAIAPAAPIASSVAPAAPAAFTDLPADRLTKLHVIAYKQHLIERFTPSTVNVGIVAVNAFLKFMGAEALCVKRVRVQETHMRRPQDDLTRDDYQKLCAAARKAGDMRGLLVVEALCSTGIRVSELEAITVGAARSGVAQVTNKGKVRAVWLPRKLCSALLKYARSEGIAEGPVLLSAHGRPLDRTTVWRIMKRLAGLAGVREEKVCPHNLRHLFATAFYGAYRDLDGLSAILGHTSVETTRIYVAGTNEKRERQVDGLRLCG